MERPDDVERRPWWPSDDSPDHETPARRGKRRERQEDKDTAGDRRTDNRSDNERPGDTPLIESGSKPEDREAGPDRPRPERRREELATTLAKLPPELRYRFERAISEDGGDWNFEMGRYMYMYLVRTEAVNTAHGPVTVRERLTLRRDRPIRVLNDAQRRQLAEVAATGAVDVGEDSVERPRPRTSHDRVEVVVRDKPPALFEVPAWGHIATDAGPVRFKRVDRPESVPDAAVPLSTAEEIDPSIDDPVRPEATATPDLQSEPITLSTDTEVAPSVPTLTDLERLIETAYRDELETVEQEEPLEEAPVVKRHESDMAQSTIDGNVPRDRPVPHEHREPDATLPIEAETASEPDTDPIDAPPETISAESKRPSDGPGFDRLVMQLVDALDERDPLPPIAGGSPELDQIQPPRRPRRPREEARPRRQTRPRVTDTDQSAIRPSRIGEERLFEWESRHRRPEDPPDRELRRKARKLARLLARRFGIRLTPETEVMLMEIILRPRTTGGRRVYGLGLNREHVLDVIRTLQLHFPAAAPRLNPGIY